MLYHKLAVWVSRAATDIDYAPYYLLRRGGEIPNGCCGHNSSCHCRHDDYNDHLTGCTHENSNPQEALQASSFTSLMRFLHSSVSTKLSSQCLYTTGSRHPWDLVSFLPLSPSKSKKNNSAHYKICLSLRPPSLYMIEI